MKIISIIILVIAIGIPVQAENKDLEVHLNAPTTDIRAGISAHFEVVVSGGQTPYTIVWAIGGKEVGIGEDLDFTFSSEGSYKLTVIVSDSLSKGHNITRVTVKAEPKQKVKAELSSSDIIGFKKHDKKLVEIVQLTPEQVALVDLIGEMNEAELKELSGYINEKFEVKTEATSKSILYVMYWSDSIRYDIINDVLPIVSD